MADRDRAAVHVDALLVEPELADAREHLAREGLVELDAVEVADRRGRRAPSTLRTAGTGPTPITAGSTPATALATIARPDRAARARGVAPRSASTTAAAPSLMPAALPAVTCRPRGRPGAARRASRPSCPARGCSSRSTRVDGPLRAGTSTATISRAKRPLGLGGRVPLLRAQRPGVLVRARDAVALGDVLAGLAHRVDAVALAHPRVHEAPAERRVGERPVAAREGRLGLARHQRRARHRLDAARHEEVAGAGLDRVRGRDDRLQARGAEAVDGLARDARPAGRRAARPCGRRCGCPRPTGWRRRARRPRCRRRRSRRAARPRRRRARRGRRAARAARAPP